MTIYKDSRYYKNTYEQGATLTSGLPLPDPKEGPYHFKGCEFHPGLEDVLNSLYADSVFENCYRGPEGY
jgi:hypothetical protein